MDVNYKLVVLATALIGFCLSTLFACPSTFLRADAAPWPGLSEKGYKYVAPRLEVLNQMKPIQDGVLFVGDSITEGAPLADLFPDVVTANYGVSWDTTQGTLLRLQQITRNQPERIFLLIGTNDTRYGRTAKDISADIFEIVRRLKAKMKSTDFYVISLLPRAPEFAPILKDINNRLAQNADTGAYTYLNLAAPMRTEDGSIDPALSYDQLHLNEAGYAVWADVLGDCVKDGCPRH